MGSPDVAPSLTPSVGAPSISSRPNVRPRIRRGEIVRKTIHMSPGLLPFALVLVPHPHPLPFLSLAVLAVLTAVLTLVYIASKRVVRRPGENDFYTTCFSYPATILLTLFLFPQHPEFTCVVAVVLALGDGSAYIGGNLFGRRKLPWNPKKSWAGTLTFISVAAPAATLAYWIEANAPTFAYWGDGRPIAVPMTMAMLCGTIAAVVASVAESLPVKITDNLRVGAAAAASVIVVHYVAAEWFLA